MHALKKKKKNQDLPMWVDKPDIIKMNPLTKMLYKLQMISLLLSCKEIKIVHCCFYAISL